MRLQDFGNIYSIHVGCLKFFSKTLTFIRLGQIVRAFSLNPCNTHRQSAFNVCFLRHFTPDLVTKPSDKVRSPYVDSNIHSRAVAVSKRGQVR